MNVVAIYEENHGFIGVATDLYKAVQFLVVYDWLDEHTPIYCGPFKEWVEIGEVYGADWFKEIVSVSIDELNTIFSGSFFFTFVPLWGE